jgi:hypothetical protein
MAHLNLLQFFMLYFEIILLKDCIILFIFVQTFIIWKFTTYLFQ